MCWAQRCALHSCPPGQVYRQLFLRDGSRNYATKRLFGEQNESNTQANSAVQAALQNEMLTG